ncbi:MAG: DUF2846 domain-containing protein [Proteobacteria bacterium]|nr:DUF2846 domain-containing protein [Pseudomonadota bacterium]
MPGRVLILTIVALSVVGCATTVPTMAELQPVPENRVFANQLQTEGNAELAVLRDKSFSGSAVDYRLFVDGKLSAQLAWGEFVIMSLPAGERIIEIRHPSPLVGAIGDSATLRAEPNVTYYYRVNSDSGQIRLLRTTAESAMTPP